MPYALPPGAGSGTTGVQLRVDTPRRFTVTTPFWYAPFRPLPPQLDALLPVPSDPPDTGHRWLAIPGGQTDLASVPGVLWGLLASYGRHTLAVIVHDHVAGLADSAPPAERFDRASAADEVLYCALRDPQAGQFRAGWFRSLVLWTGVSVARYYRHRRAGFGALAAATVGGWTAGWWLAENTGGRSFPVAGWVLLLTGLLVLAVAGVFATRLNRLRPASVGLTPAHTVPAPSRLQAAASFLPGGEQPIGRVSDSWVVRALAAAAILLLASAAWTSMPVGPLFGVGMPGLLAVLGLLAFLGGSGYLATSPVRRDAVLPLVLTIAAPTVGLVALVTVGVLYLLWLPDAFAGFDTGPVNTLTGHGGQSWGPSRDSSGDSSE
ncbi:MAG: DUF1353 domain-containing protein [Micropruina sp.]|uniref:DUF1353 domain-containing protein n=1 Tax=Micropruina sp. TaxID=2737536 RepID=UPI0039E333EC